MNRNTDSAPSNFRALPAVEWARGSYPGRSSGIDGVDGVVIVAKTARRVLRPLDIGVERFAAEPDGRLRPDAREPLIRSIL